MSQPTPPPFAPAHPSTKAPATPEKTPTGQPIPPKDDDQYINNPLSIAITGLQHFFDFVKSIAITLLAVTLLGGAFSLVANIADTIMTGDTSTDTTLDPVSDTILFDVSQVSLILVTIIPIVLVGFIISIVISAYIDASAAAIARQKKTSFGEISRVVFGRLGGYIWLSIVRAVKTLLWTLLFIVPGIIMSFRYSLAGTAFFAKNMKAVEAINYSTKITKGGVLTLFASYGLLNIITLGFIEALIKGGAQGVLFRQYARYEEEGLKKPSPSAWSIVYISLIGIVIALFLLIAVIAVLVLGSEGL